MPKLSPGSYPAFIERYLRFVEADTVAEAREKYSGDISTFFKNISADKVNYRYEAGKWNIKRNAAAYY